MITPIRHSSPPEPQARIPAHWTKALLLLVALVMLLLALVAICFLHHLFAPNGQGLPPLVAWIIPIGGAVALWWIFHSAWKRIDWLFEQFLQTGKGKRDQPRKNADGQRQPKEPGWLGSLLGSRNGDARRPSNNGASKSEEQPNEADDERSPRARDEPPK